MSRWSNRWIEVDICKRFSVSKMLSSKVACQLRTDKERGHDGLLCLFVFSLLFPSILFNFPLIFILVYSLSLDLCPSNSISLLLRLLSGGGTKVRVEAPQLASLRHQKRPDWEAEDLPGTEWRQWHYLLSNSRGYRRARGWRCRKILQSGCNHH